MYLDREHVPTNWTEKNKNSLEVHFFMRKKATIDDEWIVNYDRGWDIEPTCKEADICLSILIKAYN